MSAHPGRCSTRISRLPWICRGTLSSETLFLPTAVGSRGQIARATRFHCEAAKLRTTEGSDVREQIMLSAMKSKEKSLLTCESNQEWSTSHPTYPPHEILHRSL